MLLMVEKGIRKGKCDCIYQYAKANNKYMKNYVKIKESSRLQYWDVYNLYGWVILQKVPGNNFEQIKDTCHFNKNFIKNYNGESDEGYFLVFDVQHIEKLQELHSDLPFLPERMKIEKIKKLVAKLHDTTECAMHIKMTLNYGLAF